MERFIFCLAIVGLVSSAQAKTYSIIDLGTLGGTVSHAFDVNLHGDAVGASTLPNGQTRAFLYQDGLMTNLGVLGGHNFSQAFGVNDSGSVVGISTQDGSDQGSRPFAYSAGTLSFVGSFGGDYGWANSINNVGQIVGISRQGNGVTRAFLKSHGSMINLGSLDPNNNDYSIAYGVNASGSVTGYSLVGPRFSHAFLYRNGQMQDIGSLGGPSRGFAVNDTDQVVGASVIDEEGHERAFLWQNGVMMDLGVIGEAVTSQGLDINNRGHVVGTLVFDLDNGDLNRGFLYHDGTMIDVNTLLPENSGWVLRDAQAINDRGQIVGFGEIDGEHHAYLLSPVAGDYDGSGIVDSADYVVWRKSFGQVVERYSGSDWNGNSVVDIEDYQTWRTNFGQSAADPSSVGLASAVPEPSSVVLALCGVVAMMRRRVR